MKKILFALLVAFSMSAHAQVVGTYVWVSPYLVSSQACNPLPYPATCTVYSTGIVNNGMPIYAWASFLLPPGACDWAYVYATSPFYFVGGYSQANCN